ncbi:hypothetical protein CXG81DRAFT_28872 [Caulochytrium protostelioides]|uniref:Uncharacterized protein n=1 Tax=Caulochytrium protostelioides TaxID=1555241 RepID=A0A4P9X2E7_9FUNG|nr:hypothetical protein CXG81DRAFT_28872 [Caulochytrium protostelioides]|eukprot:RKO98286.1 hypothetical protein CXG81DRAFT_28872 [Caulochytrium protostelioides]
MAILGHAARGAARRSPSLAAASRPRTPRQATATAFAAFAQRAAAPPPPTASASAPPPSASTSSSSSSSSSLPSSSASAADAPFAAPSGLLSRSSLARSNTLTVLPTLLALRQFMAQVNDDF